MYTQRTPVYLFLLCAVVLGLIGCDPVVQPSHTTSTADPSTISPATPFVTHTAPPTPTSTPAPTTIAPPRPVISDVRQFPGMRFVINQPNAAEPIFSALNQLVFVTHPYSATLHSSGPIRDRQDYFLQIKAATQSHYWLTDSFGNQCLYFDETMYRDTQGSWGKASIEEGRSCFKPVDYLLLTLLSSIQPTQLNASCANPAAWQGKFIRLCRVEVVDQQGVALNQITFWLDAASNAPWQIITQPESNLSQEALKGLAWSYPYTITVDYGAKFELETPP